MDEQRAPNTIIPEPQRAPLSGDALRAKIAELRAQLEHEDEAAAAAELQANPPRPIYDIALDFIDHLVGLLGSNHRLEALAREAHRALGK